MRIALAGNPNSGKTTMYNALTGRNENVGNWAGVTVERRESTIKKAFCENDEEIVAVDLPGAYSMSPFTSEESITSSYVRNEKPDVIINIVDATNLSRSLFFTTQLLELGVPVVVALNKSDINEKKDTEIDTGLLSEKLGCPVINTVSTSTGHEGLLDVISAAISSRGKTQGAPYRGADTDLLDREAVEDEDRKRFEFVKDVVSKVETRKVLSDRKTGQDKVDAFLTEPLFGIPFFGLIMFLVFFISQSTLGTWASDILTGWIDLFSKWLSANMNGVSPFLEALVVDGIIGGTSAVVSFLPLVMVMYFLIALLEDCGYMARATVVMDPIFKKVGLSGKSVIPMIMGIGCGVPAIMTCRTIRSERERRATAMLTTFMPCGAKLPVIALFVGAFFPGSSWVGPLMYFVGILLILLGALLINAITGNRFKRSYFIIELPEYRFPSISRAAGSMLERGKAYIVKAGTIILVCNTAVQIMQSFNWHFDVVDKGMENTSILAWIASPISYVLVPVVGIAAWQLAAAAVTGFIAKENIVGTLAVCYGFASVAVDGDLVGTSAASAMAITKVAALAYLMFNLYSPPCVAALGAMNSEMHSAKWLWGAIGLQLSCGFTVGFFVYQFGTLFTTGSFGAGFIPGLVFILTVALFISMLIRSANRKYGGES